MILKTYTRIFTTDLDASLSLLQAIHGTKPHMRFPFGDLSLAAIGDVLVVAGSEDALAPLRGSHGPWIVDDLEQTRSQLLALRAEILRDIEAVPTGTMLYARHPDGTVVEYVQWNADLVDEHIRAPLQQGILSSQI